MLSAQPPGQGDTHWITRSGMVHVLHVYIPHPVSLYVIEIVCVWIKIFLTVYSNLYPSTIILVLYANALYTLCATGILELYI